MLDVAALIQELNSTDENHRVEAKRSRALDVQLVGASGGGVTFVEDEVDDFEHRRQSGGAVGAARQLERDVGGGQRALGSHDACATVGAGAKAGHPVGALGKAGPAGTGPAAGSRRVAGAPKRPRITEAHSLTDVIRLGDDRHSSGGA